MPAPRIVNCPRCGTAVEWTAEARFRPFCSERCKMNDLGTWATEGYRVPVDRQDEDGKGSDPDAAQEDS